MNNNMEHLAQELSKNTRKTHVALALAVALARCAHAAALAARSPPPRTPRAARARRAQTARARRRAARRALRARAAAPGRLCVLWCCCFVSCVCVCWLIV